jgi:hypothetical protein
MSHPEPDRARPDAGLRKVPMIELAAGQGTPALHALLPREGPAWRRSFTVLDGGAGGRILTDDPHAPRWCAVQEFSDAGSLILAGALDRELVAGVIGLLRRERIVTVALPSADALRALLPADPDVTDRTIDFQDRAPEVDLDRLSKPPAGLRLVCIDQALLPRCTWSPWMAASNATALDHGLGYCLLDGERVVAEAYAGPLFEDTLEMAVIAHRDYRRRGLGAIVCARTILECERLGYRTWWNADLHNVASAGLARLLGYRTEHRYDILAWHPSPATERPNAALQG